MSLIVRLRENHRRVVTYEDLFSWILTDHKHLQKTAVCCNFLSFVISLGLFFLNWCLVALQCCVSFCCRAKWISHMCIYIYQFSSVHFSSVQSLSRVRLFATPWIAARQASLSITISRSSHRLTSIESVMPSSDLILCHPLLLLPPILHSIRVFPNESALRMRWPKYWSFSFNTPLTLLVGMQTSTATMENSVEIFWELVYTRGGFMSMYGKTNTVL